MVPNDHFFGIGSWTISAVSTVQNLTNRLSSDLKGDTSRSVVHLEKINLNFSSSSFAIRFFKYAKISLSDTVTIGKFVQ